jgi:hypothetical protein
MMAEGGAATIDRHDRAGRRRMAAGEELQATLYELSRGGGIAYHFHAAARSRSSSVAVA